MSEGAPARPWAGNATEYVAALVALAGRGRAWAPPSTSRTAKWWLGVARARLGAAGTELADDIRQAQGVRRRPDKEVKNDKRRHLQNGEERERKFDALGRDEQEHVAVVVARYQREPDRRGEQREDPEKAAHPYRVCRRPGAL